MPHPVRKKPHGTYGNHSLTNFWMTAEEKGVGISAHPSLAFS
jgi:hypothetical protein